MPILTTIVLAALAFFLSRYLRRPTRPLAAQPALSPATSDPIDAFWQWWQTARAPLADAIKSRTLSDWVDPISTRVHAIDPGLAWELGPGVKSAHHLCVTAEGNGRLRVTTERWRSRAPAADATWEYYPARQPSRGDPKLTLKLGEVALPYGDVRFGLEIDDVRRHVNVIVFHPKFRDLDDNQRSTAVMLILDDVLGEDGVESWIGGVRTTLEASEAPEPRKALVDAVDALSARASEESFAILEKKDADGTVNLAVINFALKRLDHLLMESHMEVTIKYPADARGLFAEGVGDDLKQMEDALLEALGREAVYIGHETGRGRRVIHLHVAPGGAAQRIVGEWERGYPGWEIEAVAKGDPEWEALKRW